MLILDGASAEHRSFHASSWVSNDAHRHMMSLSTDSESDARGWNALSDLSCHSSLLMRTRPSAGLGLFV